MITPQDLAGMFERNLDIVRQQTKGLSHADSVLQLPFRGNCLNWVLGHIADSRNTVLQQLGQPPILSEAQAKRYGYGSEPVCEDGADILRLEELLPLLEGSQRSIEAALGRITPEELGKEMQSFMGPRTLGFMLHFLCWHETYHLGQTELLRQLAGTGDKVI